MAGDPGLAYQGALVAALKGDSGVAALVGSRIVDEPVQDIAFPYIRIGNFQTVDAGHGCGEAACELFVDIHGWSRPGSGWAFPGRTGAHKLAGAIRAALHAVVLDLGADWVMAEHLCQTGRVLMEPDDITAHAVLSFRALVDPV